MNKLLRSEWIKFSSLRMNWTLAVIGLLLGLALVVVSVLLYGSSVGDTVADTSIESRVELIGAGLAILTIFAGVLGVRAFGNEYRTGSILPSVIAAPIRTELTAAKAIVSILIGLAYGVVATVASTAVVMVGLEIKDYPLRLDDPNMIRIALGVTAVVAIYAAVGVAVGGIFRSPALGIAIVIAGPTVVEGALRAVLPHDSGQYLPFGAGQALVSSSPDGPSAVEGGLIFAGFAFILLVAANVVVSRRDLG